MCVLCVCRIQCCWLDYFFTMRKIPSYFNVCLLLQCKPQSDQEKNANNKLSFLTTGLCLTTLNLIFCFPLPGPSLLSSIPVLDIQSLHFLENSVKKTSHLPSQVWTNDRNDTETPLWACVRWLIITVRHTVQSWLWFYNLLFHQNHNLSFWHENNIYWRSLLFLANCWFH